MATQIQGFRLSPAQRRVWQLQAASRAFRSQGTLLLEGPVEEERLRSALETVIQRHEILRTVYQRIPGIRFPVQVVSDDPTFGWRMMDLSDHPEETGQAEIDKLFQRLAQRPFDLERGPLVHAQLLRLAADRHLLVLGLSALACDSQSLRNLVPELAAAYGGLGAAASEDEEEVQYVQFCEWHNELLASEESEGGREYWREQSLAGSFSLELPLENQPTDRGFAPEVLAVDLGDALVQRIDGFAREHEATPESVLLAAWQTLLWRLTGESEVGVGLLWNGREGDELEEAQGLFARCLPIPSRLDREITFAGLVPQVQERWNEAVDWQICFAAEDDQPTGQEISACFEYEERGEPAHGGEVTFSLVRRIAYSERFKVCLSAVRQARGLTLELHYDRRWLEGGRAQVLGEQFRRVLESLLDNPQGAAGDIEVLTGSERQYLLTEFDETTDAPTREASVHRLFEEQVARTPDGTALEHGDQSLTYSELNGRANQLARHLLASGIGPGAVVGICIPRSFEMVVAVLAVLKTEAAYLPLEPTYPKERLAFMISDAEVARVLTVRSQVEALEQPPETIFCLDDEWDGVAAHPETNLPGEPTAGNLAYVMYTSGSTGRPKGVMVPHRGVVHYLSWAMEAYGVQEGKGTPLFSAISFDLTVTSLFAPLLSGGHVIVIPEEMGIDSLMEVLSSGREFNFLKMTPLHLTLLSGGFSGDPLDPAPSALILGGEALTGEQLTAWRQQAPQTRVINEYGPTETTVGCCIYEVPADDPSSGSVPIGRPIAETRMFLSDRGLRLVPMGAAGELCIGGAGLARGYLGRPARTAETFVPDPFGNEGGERLYRTGDLARILPEKGLMFLGRSDSQVKIRGFRIELGEIEAVLAGHEAVREAAVLAREDTPGERRLVAYLVPEGEDAPSVDELRRFLNLQLPDFMVPTIFVPLAVLPLTANGKLDRKALPVPSTERPELEQAYVAPRTPLEEQLVEIWAEVLGIDQVGVNDSFFVLGGDSIRSVRAVALATEKGLEIEVQDLFRHQTVAGVAAYLESTGAGSEVVDEEAEMEDLVGLVEELEGLSEEAAQAKLQEMMAKLEEEETP